MKFKNLLFIFGITLLSFGILLAPIAALSGDMTKASPFSGDEMETVGDEGDLFLYNVFLTGNHSANSADTEGAIAIMGNSYVPMRRSAWDNAHFNYGAYFDDSGIGAGQELTTRHKIALLIGGTIETHTPGNAVVANGMVLVRESNFAWVNSDSIRFNGQIRTLSDTQMDELFQHLQDTLMQLCQHIDNIIDNPITYQNGNLIIPPTQDGLYSSETRSHTVLQSSFDSEVLVVFVPAINGTAFIPQLGLDELMNDDIKQIVITTDAQKAVMVGHATYNGNVYDFTTTIPGTNEKVATLLSAKTTFYFPNATQVTNFFATENSKAIAPDITANGTIDVNKPIDAMGNDYYDRTYFNGLTSHAHTAIFGSVIAPNATIFLDSGNINGYVFAKNLHQREGAEVHNYYNPYYLSLFEKPITPPTNPIPDPGPEIGSVPETFDAEKPTIPIYYPPNTGTHSYAFLYLFLVVSTLGIGILSKRKE